MKYVVVAVATLNGIFILFLFYLLIFKGTKGNTRKYNIINNSFLVLFAIILVGGCAFLAYSALTRVVPEL